MTNTEDKRPGTKTIPDWYSDAANQTRVMPTTTAADGAEYQCLADGVGREGVPHHIKYYLAA